jgi:hypothetical protein
MGTIDDGSIPMVSIDTFGLIFINVIDPSVKDFFYFDRYLSTIDHESLLLPMAIDSSVHTELIVWIKKFTEFLPIFAMATKKRPTSSEKYFNFNRIITDSINHYYRSCFTLKVSIHRLKMLEV